MIDPTGALVAVGDSLGGGATSGVDLAVTEAGAYTVRIVDAPGAFDDIEISIARTVANR